MQFILKLKALLGVFFVVCLTAMPAFAINVDDDLDPAIALEAWHLLHQAEERNNIPPGLLHAISLVETGSGLGGQMVPWPYAVNVNTSKTYKGTQDKALLDLSYLAGMGFKKFNLESTLARVRGVDEKAAKAWLKTQPKGAEYTIRGLNFSERFSNKWRAIFFVNRLLVAGHNNIDIGLMQINWRYHSQAFADLAEAFDPYHNVQYAVSYLMQHRENNDWWGSVGRYHSGTKKYADRYIQGVWAMYQKVHRLNGREG